VADKCLIQNAIDGFAIEAAAFRMPVQRRTFCNKELVVGYFVQ